MLTQMDVGHTFQMALCEPSGVSVGQYASVHVYFTRNPISQPVTYAPLY